MHAREFGGRIRTGLLPELLGVVRHLALSPSGADDEDPLHAGKSRQVEAVHVDHRGVETVVGSPFGELRGQILGVPRLGAEHDAHRAVAGGQQSLQIITAELNRLCDDLLGHYLLWFWGCGLLWFRGFLAGAFDQDDDVYRAGVSGIENVI